MHLPTDTTSGDKATTGEDAHLSPAAVRRTIAAICVLLYFQGYAMAIHGIASPWIARSFGLGESGIAGLYAWIALSAIGALVLARAADRVGRRRVLAWCTVLTPLAALCAAASTHVALFALSEIVMQACVAATVAGSVVMLAEGLPIDMRARGQSYGGVALGFGGGLCVILTPLLTEAGLSWRWLLVVSGCTLLGAPFLQRIIPESRRWERAAAAGETAATRFHDVFGPRYRRRALPLLLCALLNLTAAHAVGSWGYFHAVSVVGVSPTAASMMMLAGGAMSFLGFAGGAWAAERFGRVPTVSAAGLLLASAAVFFYWGPPSQFPSREVWLVAGFCLYMSATNALSVGSNSAATELFPTALRGTMVGWFALANAFSLLISMGSIAVLADRLGGLSVVVGYLGLLALPSAAVFASFVEETRGLALEVAAREHTPDPLP